MAGFRKNGSRIVEVDLSGESVKALTGAMIAYEGDIAFKKAGFGGGEGIRGALKRKVTGESLDLMECTGSGTVYFAHEATEIELIPLANETLQVESSSLLALDSGLRTNVTFTGLRGATAGQGLFTTTVSGNGMVALLSDGPAISSRGGAAVPARGRPGRLRGVQGAAQRSPSSPTCPGGRLSGRVPVRRFRCGSTVPAWC